MDNISVENKKFQSPIGTNKTQSFYIFLIFDASFNPLQVQTKHSFSLISENFFSWFQSPIGTNKTKSMIIFLEEMEEFQSPIGTNKTPK